MCVLRLFNVLSLILHVLLILVMRLAAEILPKRSCFPSPHFSVNVVLGRPMGPPSRAGAQEPLPQQHKKVSAFIAFIFSERETEVPRGVVA